MKTILLSKGKATVVDDDDFGWLSVFEWHYSDNPGYAQTTQEGINLYMHHMLLPPRDGFECDHWNRNKLDNRRENLRYLTHADNIRNRDKQRNNTTGFTGVYPCKRAGGRIAWQTKTRVFGKEYYLGTFATIEEAAVVYARFQADRDAGIIGKGKSRKLAQSGIPGVYMVHGGYIVRVVRDGVKVLYGYFRSLDEAVAYRKTYAGG